MPLAGTLAQQGPVCLYSHELQTDALFLRKRRELGNMTANLVLVA